MTRQLSRVLPKGGELLTELQRQMVEAEINKPMGLVLEENHPSVKVDRGAI